MLLGIGAVILDWDNAAGTPPSSKGKRGKTLNAVVPG